ncbi:DUF2079 domain-containing protein [Streptomyces sp. BE303]|uniref:DUF2079 domain-containing protein n=1 Tax=Streptomycetaceae TaxID=2062 RepID=UPI002E7A1F0C|nr:DUF2079 domain-containing protein [Streptomyces sp. BE303]MED7954952.1 DUF2079 domain-containing protein [Streptomyces sp. BE303]
MRFIPWAVALALFLVYSFFTVRRHDLLLTSGYDLGIFEQGVRGYAEGRGPIVELKGPGFNLLGDHFSPILAVLAPFYWIWPSAKVLLLGQSALLAVAAVPISRWALRSIGPAAALITGFGYGASWGLASALGFDFHEISFAVPLVAFSVAALGEQRWAAAFAWAAPLVLVKEDLGITVAAVGGYILWRGNRRIGAAAVAFGVAASLLELLVLLPAMSPGGSFAYWDNLSGGSGGRNLLTLPLDLITPGEKVRTVLLLLAPTMLLAVRSPLLLVALPTLGWRLLSNNPAYWGTGYHYSAVLMPIVFLAFVDVLVKARANPGVLHRRAARAALPVSLAVTLVLLPGFAFSQLFGLELWRTPARVEAARSVLAAVPDGARVSASNRLVPQLTNRCEVIVFGWPQSWSTAEWIVVDEGRPMGWPLSPDREREEVALAKQGGYHVVRSEHGITLLRRTATEQAGTTG